MLEYILEILMEHPRHVEIVETLKKIRESTFPSLSLPPFSTARLGAISSYSSAFHAIERFHSFCHITLRQFQVWVMEMENAVQLPTKKSHQHDLIWPLHNTF